MQRTVFLVLWAAFLAAVAHAEDAAQTEDPAPEPGQTDPAPAPPPNVGAAVGGLKGRIVIGQPGIEPPSDVPAGGEEGDDEEDLPAPPEGAVKPFFVLEDGTSAVGDLDLKALRVRTKYGILEIPVTDVERVVFGYRATPEQEKEAAALIEKMGDADHRAREEAEKKLAGMGPRVLPLLDRARGHDDPEIQTRARAAAEAIRARGPRRIREKDWILTREFPVLGDLDVTAFKVKTPFAEMTIPKDQARHLVFPSGGSGRRGVFKVGFQRRTDASLLSTRFAVRKGDRLSFKARGTLGMGWFTPDGPNQQVMMGMGMGMGMQIPSPNDIPLGALIGRIGKEGKPFLAGSKGEVTAEEEGTLMIGINWDAATAAMWGGMGIQGGGEYLVEIEALPPFTQEQPTPNPKS